MLLFRFMSRAEYNKYRAGRRLLQMTEHSKHAKTVSKGFCFMDVADIKPQRAYDFLSGIVSNEVLCIFECKDLDRAGLKKSKGLYASYPEPEWRCEYCTTSYSKETLRLVKCKDVHNWW